MGLKVRHKRSLKTGLPPGSVVHVGEVKQEKITVSLFAYKETSFVEKKMVTLEEIARYKEDTSLVDWINIDGLHDTGFIESLGNLYDIHPLLLEDIVSSHQRPKMDEYGNCLFLVARMIYLEEKTNQIHTEQISFILTKDAVLSFQEKEGDVFDNIRERIRKSKGRVRKLGADYLLYALLDTIIDHYFVVIEKIGDRIEVLEDELFANPNTKTVEEIHKLKREMIFLKKSVWPLREVINSLNRSENTFISPATSVFLKDLYDHIIQIIDTIETYKDVLSGMLEMYLSSISNKLNQVMKVLTIISTIFIPLTFIVGVYGMNFDNMPELQWKYGYLSVWIAMILLFGGMIVYFKKKKWL